jgi:hypothetical protein
MNFATKPALELSASDLQRYEKDGVIVLRKAIDANWLSLLEAGIEQSRKSPSLLGWYMSRNLKGYEMDTFLWKRNNFLKAAVYLGPFAHWAKALMQSQEVRFFYDQMFVKEPGSDAPTPWHQDLSFWPVRGEKICSFWIPLDPVSRESSGLMYVGGSHKWPQRFKAISPDYVATIIDESMDDIPDINANPDKYNLLDWDMEPGDILMFHPLTLHGSYGNRSRKRRRRALALRWVGDDVIYAPSPKRMPIHYRHESVPGGPLRGLAFPRILPSVLPNEIEAWNSPEEPSWLPLIASFANDVIARAKLRVGAATALQSAQSWKP